MSREKQIEEMARDICRVKQNCNDVCHPINSCRALKYAERFYNAGYRKQSEGEWIILLEDDSPWDSIWTCNRCGAYTTTEEPAYKNFCPNCGAKKKGGAE